MTALLAQLRAEVRMTIRRGETLLLTLGIPVLLLVFFSLSHVTAVSGPSRVGFIAPGIIALSVLSTSLVALSIATGFERSYGVLRRLHVTPLGRRRLIAAKILGVLATEVLQVVVLGLVAFAIGWRPHGGLAGAASVVAVLLLGTAGCAGIGLFLAGSLRAEVNLAATNGLYLVLLLGSGLVVPLASLPRAVGSVARVIPTGAMGDALRAITQLGHPPRGSDWIVLVLWALGAPALAARTFRFE